MKRRTTTLLLKRARRRMYHSIRGQTYSDKEPQFSHLFRGWAGMEMELYSVLEDLDLKIQEIIPQSNSQYCAVWRWWWWATQKTLWMLSELRISTNDPMIAVTNEAIKTILKILTALINQQSSQAWLDPLWMFHQIILESQLHIFNSNLILQTKSLTPPPLSL